MNLEIASILVFFGIVGIIAYIDRKNIEFKYVVLIRRSKRGVEIINRLAKKHRKKLRILGNIAILVCMIASIYGFSMLVSSSYDIFFRPEKVVQPVKLILPSVTGVKMPSFILGVPFWYWIIGVFLVVSIHEPMHALLARAENIKIKSFGIFMALVFPGAFVEPDEKQIKKLSTSKKLRIFAAGSFGNFIFAGLVILLVMGYSFLLNSLLTGKGIAFDGTIENTGAAAVGLEGIIIEINGIPTESTGDLENVLNDIKPGDEIEVKTTEGVFTVKTIFHPDNPEIAFMGVKNTRTVFEYKSLLKGFGVVSDGAIYTISWFFGLFEWLFIISFGVGVFNLFPLKPLDGGLMMETIAEHFYKKKAKVLANGISVFTLVLVLITLLGPSLFT